METPVHGVGRGVPYLKRYMVERSVDASGSFLMRGRRSIPIEIAAPDSWTDIQKRACRRLFMNSPRRISITLAAVLIAGSFLIPPARAQLNEMVDLTRKVTELTQSGKYSEAEPLARRVLEIAQSIDPNNPAIGVALNSLGFIYVKQGRYAEAEPLYQRAVAILERAGNPGALAIALNNLALLYQSQARHAEALQPYKQALALLERTLPPGDPRIATALSNIGLLYQNLGRYADAEAFYKRSLTVLQSAHDPNDPAVAIVLNNLAGLYKIQGRYADAKPLLERVVMIEEKVHPDHPETGTALNNLAVIYQDLARYADAETYFKRALVLREMALPADHPDVAQTLENLATLYYDLGRYADAEPLYRRALPIKEKALGSNHPDVALLLHNLATLYSSQGRYADAEPLFKRSLAIRENAPNHPDVAVTLNGLALTYSNQGRYAEAEALYKRALAITERAFGDHHPEIARLLTDLAALYDSQGRHADAEPLYKRALPIWEKVFGPDHPDVAITLHNLAVLCQRQGRYAEAEALYKRALAIREKALGPDHPDFALSLNGLASLYGVQGRYADALPLVRRAISSAHAAPSIALTVLFGAQQKGISGAGVLDDALEVVQRATQTSAATAVDKLAARFAAGTGRLAQLVRRDQDLAAEGDLLDRAMLAAVSKDPSKRDVTAEQRIRDRRAAVEAERRKLEAVFSSQFPDYAALSRPQPLTVKDIQALLSDREALVLLMPDDKVTWAFAVTRKAVRWVRSDQGREALGRNVAALRCGLDAGRWDEGSRGLVRNDAGRPPNAPPVSGAQFCEALFGQPAANQAMLPFDLGRARALYKELFGQMDDVVADKDLLIVSSGPLTALPFQVLVTAEPDEALPHNTDGYASAKWLGLRQAIAVLPSAASLRVLRSHNQASAAPSPYLGIGNPLLTGPSGNDRSAFERQDCASEAASVKGGRRGFLRPFPGELAAVEDLRRQPPLPDTADEVCAVAKRLGADPRTSVNLGARATEARVKEMSRSGALARARILHFATHGLVAGETREIAGLSEAEPALLLTPPRTASQEDDGLLTASEVAGLKLDADWVILSACNTAAGDVAGVETLSGLARTFFYAGARALLVSHWYVDSATAVDLVTGTFDALATDPAMGRSEALRRAMTELIARGGRNAHPALWAPFTVVGEGGAPPAVNPSR